MNWNAAAGWGVKLLALWSMLLSILAAAQLLVISELLDMFGQQPERQLLSWGIIFLYIAFTIGFAAGSYGLWSQYNWGRVAFLWLITLWAGFNIASLFISANPAVPRPAGVQLAVTGVRFFAAWGISFFYLNRPPVKELFRPEPSQTEISTETS